METLKDKQWATGYKHFTEQQKLFETIKNKVKNCRDRTQLCATIYPWVLYLFHKYAGRERTRWTEDSFWNEIYDFKCSLSVYLLAIPLVISPAARPLDLEHMRNEALNAAVEMAVCIANIEVQQCSIKLSAIMSDFVKNL